MTETPDTDIGPEFFLAFDKTRMKKVSMQVFYLDGQTELEAIEDLQFIGTLYKRLNTSPSLRTVLFSQTDTKEYMIDEFSCQTVNNLLQNKGYDNPVVQYHHDNIV